MDDNLLSGYFRELEGEGWQTPTVQDDVWETVYDGHIVKLRVSLNWIYIQTRISDSLDLPVDQLHLLNDRLLMAKVCRSSDEHLFLAAEWPVMHVNRATFRLATSSISNALRLLDDLKTWQNPAESNDGQLALYIPQERIRQYLRQIDMYGWSLAGEPSDTCWQFGYRGHSPFEVQMIFSANWTHFQSPLRIKSISDSAAFFNYLFHLNSSMVMAKFRVSNKGLGLAIQCPTEHLSFGLFETCMYGMSTYLDRFASEVILLASSARLAEYAKSGRLPPPEKPGYYDDSSTS